MQEIGPYLKKKGTHFRISMSMQERVAMSLHRLDSGDKLQNIRDLNEVHTGTLSKIVRKFCRGRKHLQPVFV